MVANVARSQFSYLADSKAHVSIALGDARLSLQDEPERKFDVLVVDAFSGDSIPVHLLTREAAETYFRHLNSGGIIAYHVSNNFLNLVPIVSDIATDLSKSALLVRSAPLPAEQVLPADWVLVSGDSSVLEDIRSTLSGAMMLGRSGGRVWTDQYSNLLSALR